MIPSTPDVFSTTNMTLSSGYALGCQYLGLDDAYTQMALPALVLSGIFFGTNLVTVAWRAITHTREFPGEKK